MPDVTTLRATDEAVEYRADATGLWWVWSHHHVWS
jgi:hypothetical protein